MSQRTILSALLALTALAGAVVGSAPASAQDARLSSRPYSPDEIVRVEGRLNVQATIAFGEGEKIENVAVGDSESWQIAPNKRADLLFIKPLTETARTNMTVVTDRHTYFFDLVASPKAQPIYSLRFTYATPAPAAVPATASVVAAAPAIAQPAAAAAAEPEAVQSSAAEQRAQARRVAAAADAARAAEAKRIDDQRKTERQAARARAAAEAKRVADARAAERAAQRAAATGTGTSETAQAATAGAPVAAAATAAAPAWKRSGSRELMPQTIYDDGRATFAVWPAGQPLPQMLVADAQGREVPVEFAVDGEKIVIPGVPGRIILRANGRSGTLEPGRAVTVARPGSAGQ